ncbi:Hypothetical_protein [Hexamita inflata]|uniref:Hypothetical_protein n=1 Tax=Hexamita inflata TaxID=28002 RepID=A0AA86QQZ7_9EUKA|nr:Hypothetical protein HINF_LOCUS49062 [Hexamita inflata]
MSEVISLKYTSKQKPAEQVKQSEQLPIVRLTQKFVQDNYQKQLIAQYKSIQQNLASLKLKYPLESIQNQIIALEHELSQALVPNCTFDLERLKTEKLNSFTISTQINQFKYSERKMTLAPFTFTVSPSVDQVNQFIEVIKSGEQIIQFVNLMIGQKYEETEIIEAQDEIINKLKQLEEIIDKTDAEIECKMK